MTGSVDTETEVVRAALSATRQALKRLVTDALNEHLALLRARRAELACDPGHVAQILAAGQARAAEIADHTLD